MSNDIEAALHRANKLITWMSTYVGNMAPGDYSDCYRDLNNHWVFMAKLKSPVKPGEES